MADILLILFLLVLVVFLSWGVITNKPSKDGGWIP
jgi:hypothetical protein